MKLSALECALGRVEGFQSPRVELEQYPTPAHLAASIIYSASEVHDDIRGCHVIDLGCGPGVLAIGAALMGATCVTGIDLDRSSLQVAHRNAEALGVADSIEFVQADVVELSSTRHAALADTVILNPPFGTKRKGADIAFLQVAVAHCRGSVYSLHKSSTRKYIRRITESWCTDADVVAELRFDIPSMYAFHKKGNVDVDVDLWRIDVSKRPASACFGVDARDLQASEPSLPVRRTSRNRPAHRKAKR